MRSLTRDTKSFVSISGLCPSGLYLGEAGEAEAEVEAQVEADVEGDVDVDIEDEVKVMIWVDANTEYCSPKKLDGVAPLIADPHRSPIGKIHPFSKMAVTFEPLM